MDAVVGVVGCRAGAGRQGDAQDDAALGGELHGVRHQVQQDLTEAGGVTGDVQRHVGGDDDDEFEALEVGEGREGFDDVVEGVAELERAVGDLNLAGLDAGIVEDVVERLVEGFGGGAEGGEVVALAGLEGVVEEEVGRAHDAVEVTADVAAECGEHFALGLVLAGEGFLLLENVGGPILFLGEEALPLGEGEARVFLAAPNPPDQKGESDGGEGRGHGFEPAGFRQENLQREIGGGGGDHAALSPSRGPNLKPIINESDFRRRRRSGCGRGAGGRRRGAGWERVRARADGRAAGWVGRRAVGRAGSRRVGG
jgi:hypothetical protein